MHWDRINSIFVQEEEEEEEEEGHDIKRETPILDCKTVVFFANASNAINIQRKATR